MIYFRKEKAGKAKAGKEKAATRFLVLRLLPSRTITDTVSIKHYDARITMRGSKIL